MCHPTGSSGRLSLMHIHKISIQKFSLRTKFHLLSKFKFPTSTAESHAKTHKSGNYLIKSAALSEVLSCKYTIRPRGMNNHLEPTEVGDRKTFGGKVQPANGGTNDPPRNYLQATLMARTARR